MKHLVRLGLLSLCAGLGACAAMQEEAQASDRQSSGALNADAPLTVLAITANPALSSNTSDESGDVSLDPSVVPAINRFAADFAHRVAADFGPTLVARGVAVRDPGRGIPLLRFKVSSYRTHCPYRHDSCQAEVRIDAAVLGDNGSRAWWFNDWVLLESMNETGYRKFYQQLLDTMVKDQVIAP